MFVPMFVFWFVAATIVIAAYPQQAIWLVGVYLFIKFASSQ